MEIIGIMGFIFILAACCFTVYYENVNSGNTFILYLVLLCLGAGAIMLSFMDKFKYEAAKVPTRITGFVLITIAMLFIFRYFYKKKYCGLAMDKYNLERFVSKHKESYDIAYKELSQGMKQSHWMWWIFPQIIGLGMTSISKQYSIKSIEEARAFLKHPYLGKNIREICKVLLNIESNDANYVMGYPDDLKLCSSMTLFIEADPDDITFQKVLDKFFDGRKDNRTLKILKNQI